MQFPESLHRGTLTKRYKRFLADVQLDTGETVTAHCPNTGSMKSCGAPGDIVYLSYNDSKTRKLKYTWELSKVNGALVGVNTALPNQIVAESIEAGKVPELAGYQKLKREVKYGKNSRIDIMLTERESHPDSLCYVEVKNVTLLDQDCMYFPDAVTARGTKHLQELADSIKPGKVRACIFFLVNRTDGSQFKVAEAIDPVYADAFQVAAACGVEVLCYRTNISLEGIHLGDAVPWS